MFRAGVQASTTPIVVSHPGKVWENNTDPTFIISRDITPVGENGSIVSMVN
jgi:hypothetical protein